MPATNGAQLARHASELAVRGVRRINVSVDTLDEADHRVTATGEARLAGYSFFCSGKASVVRKHAASMRAEPVRQAVMPPH